MEAQEIRRWERPTTLEATVPKVRTAHGSLYVIVGTDKEGNPREVFAKLGKAGGCESAQMEGLTRMVSIALQYGVPLTEVVSQLRSISCHPFFDNGIQNTSPIDAIGHVLEKYLPKEEDEKEVDRTNPKGTRPERLPKKFDGVTLEMLNSKKGRKARIEQDKSQEEVYKRMERQKRGLE